MKKLFLLLLLLFPLPAEAQFLSDAMTDTNGVAMTTHCTNAGYTCTVDYGSGTNTQIQTNKAYIAGTTDATQQSILYTTGATPYTVNYKIQGVCNASALTGSANNLCGVIGRRTSSTSYYIARLTGGATQHLEIAAHSSTFHSLDSTVVTWTAGADATVRLDVITLTNGSVQLKSYLNNVLIASINDNTYKLATAGTAGFTIRQAGGGQTTTFDTLVADGIRPRRIM